MSETMRAVIFPGDGAAVLTTKPVPEPGFGEVLLHLRAAGVCGSDLHFMHQSADEMRNSSLGKGMSRDPGLTPGHEIAGVVPALGEGVRELAIGDRVAIHHDSGCGRCDLGVPRVVPAAPVLVGRHVTAVRRRHHSDTAAVVPQR